MQRFRRCQWVTLLGVILLVTGSPVYGEVDTETPPNFIIIFTDDQGYQDLGVFGSPNIKTPHIDRMAGEGMRFTDFYSAASVCTPSRAALLTGCYPERVGGLGVLFPDQSKGLNPAETTIARMLKGVGYATICIGKWHLGHKREFLPTSHGFDSYYGIPYSNDMWIDPAMALAKDVKLREGMTLEGIREQNIKRKRKRNLVPLMRNEEVIEYPADQNTLTQRYTKEAIKFITSHKDRPFFLYLPHTMPHIPLYASPAFEGKSDAGLYGDCIEEIDWSVGQIIETLKRLGLDKNTLIVYTSDNGPWNLKGNATDKVKGNMNRRTGGSALPLRGYKFQRWEGGMREPTVMWWPGRIPAGRECHEVAGTIDLLPTIAELSGAKLPDKKIDGKSIVPLIEGRDRAKSPHEVYFYRTEAVRCGKWKLKKNALYDLSEDISEERDLATQHPNIVARMRRLLEDHKQELKENKRPNGAVTPSHYITINAVGNTDADFEEIVKTFGKAEGRNTCVGVGFIISVLNMAPEQAAERLDKYLSLSERHDVPVLVQLDGESWWGHRPDLWNWWDPGKPGYNPDNRNNVEWTDWTSDAAVKIGWRNWGRQLRVLPMPNLMSPAYREATRTEMAKLIKQVMAWWRALPEDRKYLLVGVKLGWESSIGVNNWVYPDSNSYLNRPEKDDPTHGIKIDRIPDRGVTTIGYAAVKTAGIASSGKLTGAMQAEVVRRHLTDWCRLAAEFGVPRERLFTHCGAWSQGEDLYWAALNKYACPGWSFYKHAIDPANDNTAMEAFITSDAPYWAATEWLYQGEHSKEEWVSALKNTIFGANARYLCIYNWRDVKRNRQATEAIKQVGKMSR